MAISPGPVTPTGVALMRYPDCGWCAVGWRNGPIENIHAGLVSAYPLTQRRITPAQEQTLVRTVASQLAQALLAAYGLIHEQSDRTWAERVLPFHLSPVLPPKGWSLEESTGEVRLDGAEPGLSGAVPRRRDRGTG